jgi:putative phosphoesterase
VRVGILSDTHDRLEPVLHALDILHMQGIAHVFHCGDIESADTLRQFAGFQAHFVPGNWDGDKAWLQRAAEEIGATWHDPWGEIELEQRRIAWIHSDDRKLFRELEQSDTYDFLFYGHSHRAESHRTGRTLVLNPGALFRARPRTLAILDLASGQVESVVVE